MTESAIVTRQVQYLRAAGWFVVVFAQDKPTRRQSAGWGDIFAAKFDVALIIEAKTRTGRVRDSQKRMRDGLLPHTGPHLYYRVARSLDRLIEVVAEIEEGR